MENNTEKILNDYQSADFNRRLHIFLDYPRLRPEFLMIDEYELKTKTSSKSKKRHRSVSGYLNVAMVTAIHGFKRFWKI